MLRTESRLLSALVMLSAVPFARAVETPAARTQEPVRYEAEFFASFSPRTALDMVTRVPGFALRDVEEKRRGYSAAAGNVLIDGERPSAKSQTLEDILGRIPAAQVRHIEVLRGTETGADVSGDSVLVNVVRTPSAGAGYWSTGFEYAQQEEPAPNGVLSWTGRIGKIDYALGASTYSLQREQPGTRVVTDGAGDVTALRYETSPREFAEYAINGEVARDLFGGRVRATGQASQSHYEQANTLEDRSVEGVLLADQLLPYAEDKSALEFGTHFERATSLGDWTLAAILTRKQFDGETRVTNRDAGLNVQSVFQQLTSRDTGESIVRSTFTLTPAQGQQVQIGIEGALNTLDADLDLTGEFGGAVVPITVPNANMHVEEKRGEAFAAYTWRCNVWSTEARLAGEYSRLDFSGDVSQVVDLSYFKPSLQLARNFGRQNQFRVRVARDVGQLDFNDFATVVSVSDNLIDSGNPDLKPQTSWRVELATDLHLSAQTVLSARLFHDWLSDVVDMVVLDGSSGRIAAPGNIGDGTLDGLQLTFTTSLAPVIPGGTFNVDTTLQDAGVTDPVTGRTRTISEFISNKIKAEFRHDTNRQGLAWGIKYTRESSQTDYRLDQTDLTRKAPSLEAFVEHKVFGAMKLHLAWLSDHGSPELRTRRFYDGDRTGPLAGGEDTRSRQGHWVLLTLSGSF